MVYIQAWLNIFVDDLEQPHKIEKIKRFYKINDITIMIFIPKE
jgi:hypothetical protein